MVSKYGECPVSFVDITDPVQTPCCKQIFQKIDDPDTELSLHRWVRDKSDCPMCREPLTVEQIITIEKVVDVANSNIKDQGKEPASKKPKIASAEEEAAIEPAIRVLAPQAPLAVAPAALAPLHISHLTQYELEETFPEFMLNEHFSRVPADEVVNAIANNTLPIWLYRKLSDNQMQAVRLIELGRERISRFFPLYINTEENRRKFALLQPADVAGALLLDKLSQQLYKLLSDAQFQAIQISGLSQEQITALFHGIDLAEQRRRFALIPPAEVQETIRLGTLSEPLYKLLSDAQLQDLRLLELNGQQILSLFPNNLPGDEKRRRFALLRADVVLAAIEANTLPLSFYKLLSDDQLRAVRLSELREEQMNWIFPASIQNEENMRRFAFITSEEVLATVRLKALPLRLQDLLSDAHIDVINNA